MIEEWKNYNYAYQVSDLGRVRSVDRLSLRNNGTSQRVRGRILKKVITKRGYEVVCLTKEGNKQVHQLVAKVFLNHTPNGNKMVVDHINNKPDDNRLCNLRIVTNQYNIERSPKYANGVS